MYLDYADEDYMCIRFGDEDFFPLFIDREGNYLFSLGYLDKVDDIQDGYDSLALLRKEYKKFPSDAYKYITPAIQRLLKHQAIKYKE